MFINTGGAAYGDRNCGLCTIGAILGLPSGTVAAMLGFKSAFQSEDVFGARAIPGASPKEKVAAFTKLSADEQQRLSLETMRGLVKQFRAHKNAECFASQGGSETSLVPMRVQLTFMRSFPVGTRFAVYSCMEMKGLGAHWNYAERTADGLVFRDYQYNVAEDVPPRESDAFIPPKGQPGTASREYTQAVVLAFRSQRRLV